MMEITILSGKGGAGKTSVTAALSTLAQNAVFCDSDVDAADLHLILQPDVKETYDFDSGSIAEINSETCINCGKCKELCRFDAIHTNEAGDFFVNPFQCEGCKLCQRICPADAINVKQNLNNHWFVSETRFGTMVHAKMGAGEENSGRLVTCIRKKAMEIAKTQNAELILNDGPPGIGCSAIASVTGTNLVVLVIEPSISGLHDAQRLISLVNSFEIPMVAVINKFDINPEFTKKTEDFLNESGIQIIGKIPFDNTITEAMIHEKSVIEFAPNSASGCAFLNTWEQLKEQF